MTSKRHKAESMRNLRIKLSVLKKRDPNSLSDFEKKMLIALGNTIRERELANKVGVLHAK